MNKDVKKVLFTEEQITSRSKQIAEEIDHDYQGKDPLIVGLLKGSVPFMAELLKNIKIDCRTDYMAVSSYSGCESMGDVKIVKDLDQSIVDQNILIVEDIIDTGLTIKKVKDLMYQKGAKSVKVATLLDKKERRIVEINGDYVGFDCPNEFVIGFGLDFNQRYRNLPYVGVLKEECYK